MSRVQVALTMKAMVAIEIKALVPRTRDDESCQTSRYAASRTDGKDRAAEIDAAGESGRAQPHAANAKLLAKITQRS
jgi:hypothetical protein